MRALILLLLFCSGRSPPKTANPSVAARRRLRLHPRLQPGLGKGLGQPARSRPLVERIRRHGRGPSRMECLALAPVSPISAAPSLVAPASCLCTSGCRPGSADPAGLRATHMLNLAEVEREFRAQIARAKSSGLDIKYVDCQMGMACREQILPITRKIRSRPLHPHRRPPSARSRTAQAHSRPMDVRRPPRRRPPNSVPSTQDRANAGPISAAPSSLCRPTPRSASSSTNSASSSTAPAIFSTTKPARLDDSPQTVRSPSGR